MNSLEEQIIDISLKIGSIAEKNSQYIHGLSLRLSKIDTSIDQLTVGALIEQIDQYTTGFNAIFGGES